MASGDTLIVGGGTYRETVSVAMTSAVAETTITADYDNLTGDGADVRFSAYTTDDTTTPATSPTLTLAGRDYLTFDGIQFIGGNAGVSCVSSTAGSAEHITFRRCTFISSRVTSGGSNIAVTSAANTVLSWLIDSCLFVWSSVNSAIVVTGTRPTGGDFDLDVQIRNCLSFGGSGQLVQFTTTGANASNPGGVDIENCGHICSSGIIVVSVATASTTIPCTVNRCWIICSGAPFNANTSGQIIEDYNRVFSGTAYTNTSTGLNSIVGVTHALLLNLGQESFWSMYPRPFGTPLAGSPLLGQGGTGTALTTDLLNRPRPAGGADPDIGWGPLERHDTARIGASLGADAGGYLEIVGPGDHDILIPVTAVPTTVTVKVRWDVTHADTTKPRASILSGGEVGWPDETVTATGTAGSAYETLTFTTRTPTASGVITLRLISRSAGGAGIAAFDTIAVTT